MARKIFINKLIDNKRKEDILNKLKNIIPTRNDTNSGIILRKYILKWKEQKDKMNNRENNLRKAMKAIEQNIVKTDVEKLNSVLLVKKIAHDIPYARAKLFFGNLRKINDTKIYRKI